MCAHVHVYMCAWVVHVCMCAGVQCHVYNAIICAKGDVSFSEMSNDNGTALLLDNYCTITVASVTRHIMLQWFPTEGDASTTGMANLVAAHYLLPTLRAVHVPVDGRARRWREKHRYICLIYALALANGH
jgi:hypothetical protein